MKYTEIRLEDSLVELLEIEGYIYSINDLQDSLYHGIIRSDLERFLYRQYPSLSSVELEQIVKTLTSHSISDLEKSNNQIVKLLTCGFSLERENLHSESLYIRYIDCNAATCATSNIFRIKECSQTTKNGGHHPDIIVFVNGIPIVVIECKKLLLAYDRFSDQSPRMDQLKESIPSLMQYCIFYAITDRHHCKLGLPFKHDNLFKKYGIVDVESEACVLPRLFSDIFTKKKFCSIIQSLGIYWN